MPYLCLWRRNFCTAGGVLLWLRRCVFWTVESLFSSTVVVQNMLALHYRLERFDYLDFLPKRPQGTTKILGTSAFAGTKTPAALKFSSKGATTDCAETPVNCPHCGQKWRLRRRLRRQPFILLSFSSSEKLRKAQEMQSYQRIQCIGHTDFNTSGTNGSRSLSRVKVGTHSPLLKGSHTAAYTPKQAAFRTGVVSLLSERSARSPTSPGRVSERQVLPLLGLGRRRS